MKKRFPNGWFMCDLEWIAHGSESRRVGRNGRSLTKTMWPFLATTLRALTSPSISLEVSAAGWEEEEIQTLVVTWISCFLLPLPKARRVNVSERRVPSFGVDVFSQRKPSWARAHVHLPSLPTTTTFFLWWSLGTVGVRMVLWFLFS